MVNGQETKLQELQERIIHCRQFACPFRNKARGFYPKPPRGPATAPVMIVFENPAPPGGHNEGRVNKAEMNYDICEINLADALEMSVRNQKKWLFNNQGADEGMWDDFGCIIGETVYTTDSHKCPDPKDEEKKKPAVKDKARIFCLDYLRKEICLINPRVIIAFGESARSSLAEIENVTWNGHITKLLPNQRTKKQNNRFYALLPHPSWYRHEFGTQGYKMFNEDVRFVFTQAKEFLEEDKSEEISK